MGVLRWLHALVFASSREGRAAEIVGWSNGLASLALGIALAAWARAPWALAGLAALVLFVLLRLALAHRVTVWIAALAGVLTTAAVGGGVGWVLGHAIESWAFAPALAAASGALAVAGPTAWAFSRYLRRRAEDAPDSLVDPVSLAPPSW